MLLALTRAVPRGIDRCELTHLERTPIDYARAVAQHAAYEDALRRMGCEVRRLPAADDLPDSVFVEDTAVVFDELAVIARPGAASRRAEVDAVTAALQPLRRLAYIRPPGTLDGGDVLVTSGRVFVGVTGRTNADGARQLATAIAPLGFETVSVRVTGCLHLKSAVTLVDLSRPAHPEHPPTVLLNSDWVDPCVFAGFGVIEVDPAEPMAANVLSIDGQVLCAAEYPRTRRRLEAHGAVTTLVPAGELAKAEGGLTCGAILIRMA